jgi:hypothetical protein
VEYNATPSLKGKVSNLLAGTTSTSHESSYDSPQNLLAYLSDSKTSRSGKKDHFARYSIELKSSSTGVSNPHSARGVVATTRKFAEPPIPPQGANSSLRNDAVIPPSAVLVPTPTTREHNSAGTLAGGETSHGSAFRPFHRHGPSAAHPAPMRAPYSAFANPPDGRR